MESSPGSTLPLWAHLDSPRRRVRKEGRQDRVWGIPVFKEWAEEVPEGLAREAAGQPRTRPWTEGRGLSGEAAVQERRIEAFGKGATAWGESVTVWRNPAPPLVAV